jgi:AcrR family transcriptional regulator
MRRRRIRQAKSTDRREQIVKVALTSFINLGFSETTMRVIHQRSKASMGSIYHHFKGKEELAATIYLEGLARYHEDFLDNLERQPTAREGVKAVVRYHMRWVEKNPDWARYLFHMRRSDYQAAGEANIKTQYRQFLKRVGVWMRPFVDDGTVSDLPLDLYAALVMGPCHDFAREWLMGTTKTSLKNVTAPGSAPPCS